MEIYPGHTSCRIAANANPFTEVSEVGEGPRIEWRGLEALLPSHKSLCFCSWCCFSQRLISETEPAELQVMPVQLQRFSRLVSDQEWRKEEGARLFFHFTRASPSCLVARMDSSDERKKTKRRRWEGLTKCAMFLLNWVMNLIPHCTLVFICCICLVI